MIKVIAFDFVGVLVNEKDTNLSPVEEQLERMFGPNTNDTNYLTAAQKIINNESAVITITKSLIKIIVATNHLSFVRNFIEDNFNTNYLDDIIISAEINKIKPNADFYKYILNKYNISAEELLFLDDNNDNIIGANKLNMNTIKVTKNTNLFSEITKVINNISKGCD